MFIHYGIIKKIEFQEEELGVRLYIVKSDWN